MVKTANKISYLVESQLPDFINEEYELFSKFIQKYYEQLELQGQPVDIIANLQSYRDIDFYETNILKESTTIVGSLGQLSTTITVADATSFPKYGGYIKIDDEICFYAERTDTQFLEVSRGVSGNTTIGDLYNASTFVTTQADTHVNGSTVQNISNLFLYSLVKSFEAQYLADFPEAYLKEGVDKRTLLKNITDFYRAKGTDSSIKFLFKCLIQDDPNPDVAYPRDFTLKSSESNWIQSYALRVKILAGDPNDLIGKQITQNVEGNYASAIVDNVKYSGTFDNEELYDIILSEPSVNGTFTSSLKTQLTSPVPASTTVGDRINVFSTMGWETKGSFVIGDEIFTFEEKNVNQFVIKTRNGNGSYQSGTTVSYNIEVSSGDIELQVFGLLYGLNNSIESPYSNPGESVEISESGFLTDDIRINDTQNNLRWIFSTGSAAVAGLNSNVSAIFEDGSGYYIASSGFPSHVIPTLPSDAQDQKLLKIIRKHPIQTTEIYKTLYRDIGIAINGIPFLSYKDEEVVNSGAIQSIAVTSRGSGYAKPPFVLINGVSNLARTRLAGQVVESVIVDTPGDYNSVPNVEVLSGRNAQARAIITNGEITSIVVENAGEYYSSAPEVRITDSAGRGRFAVYRAVVTTAGAIDRFEKINGGSLYSQENVQVDIIAVGSGSEATASIRKWRKDKYYKNKSSLDAENGYFFNNSLSYLGSGYAYYAAPSTIRSGDTGVNHSPIIGFAYDGNPIYGPFGHQNPLDSQSTITRMTSSYTRNNSRSNGPLVSQYPIGTFIDDFTYIAEYGSLDQNNGRYCVTPDYPEGTYAYFITLDSQDDPVFPYILGDNYYSLPVDSNYNSELSQDNIPKFAKRLRTSNITKNGEFALAKITDVKRGSISSVSILNSTSNFSVGSELIIDNSDTDGFGASAEVSSVKGRSVDSIESQDTKALFVELKTTAYLFDGDTITQSVTGATGKIVGNVFSGTKFALRDVSGTFNSTDVLSSNVKVISLFLDKNSSYTKGATLEFTDGLNVPVATGEVLETTTKQNIVKIKVLTGSFVVSDTLFLRSSDLINTTGSKVITINLLSDDLIIFNLKDNVAILTTSDEHGIAEGDIINIDINPDDASTTTTYYLRSRVYQEATLQTPGITRVLNDNGIGKVSILNGGEDYTTNTYNDLALVGGSGSGAKANIVVSSTGSVTSVTITEKGTGYELFDVLTVGDTSLSKTNANTPAVQINIDHIGLSLTETVVNLNSNVGINPGDRLSIGNEIITVLSRVVNSTKSINVTRGATPLNHFNGATVSTYNAGYVISLGTTVGDASIFSYDSTTQKIVFVYNYGQTVSSINPIDLSTVFFDQEQRLAGMTSVQDPIRCFEFSLDNNSFTRNQLIDIKEDYRYIFDSSHSSMNDVEFDISPSKNLNLKTLEALRGNNVLDVKFGFGPRIATNNYSTKSEVSFKTYFYFDKLNNVQSEGSFIKVIPDPLQGSKSALYITPTKVVYDTITLATNDGSGSIEYTSKSRFSVGKINAIGVINIGNDYKKVPSVMGIMPTNKSTATAIVENGKIVGVSVKTGGSGYVNPIVFVEGNAKLKAIIDQGRITGIEVVNSGFGYTTPPVVKIAESDVECLINSDDIGVPRNINVINVGGSFHEDNTLRSTFRSNYILSLSNFDPDCFAIGETIVQEINNVEVARARITSFRSGRLSVDRVSGVFREKKLIKGLARNKSATLETIRYTEFAPQIKTYYDNQGYFESDSGKVSDQNQRITDSFYYQDYSYLVKSKTSIDSWRSLIKSTTHPAGFKVFGEVLIESASNASMSDDSKFIGTSIVQIWNPNVNKISVISTKKNITQSIVLMDSLKVEKGVGSVATESFNTSEIISNEVYLTESFDGNFGDKGNLQGKTIFNIVDVNGNSIKPYNEQALTITLDAVLQEPGISYTVNGDKITFSSPPLGPTNKDGQSVPGVLFYGRNFQFKSDTLNQRYLKKIKNIFQRSGTWIDAANQINQNRRFIQSETLGYVKSKYTSIPWTNLSEKCYRDIGLILDSLEHDLRFGGNQKTLFAVEKYFNAGVLNYISGELEATIDAFEYAVRLSKLASRNWDYSDRQVSWTVGTNQVTITNTDDIAIGMKVSSGRSFPDGTIITDIIDGRTIQVSNNSVAVTPDPSGNADMTFIWSGLNVGTYFDASTLIEKNKSSMITDTINAINTKYLALASTNYSTKCSRDLGLLVDAVNYCLKYGGNRKIVEFAESYFVDGNLNYIKDELNETVYAHKVLRDLMIAAMRNQGSVKDNSIRIDSSSPACAEVASSITTYIDIVESILEGGPNRVDTVEQNSNSTGYWTTFTSYSNYNILPDPLLLSELKECEEVASALDSLFENVRETLTTGPQTSSISYPDYINGENTIFELYYEDGTPVDTEINENLFIALSGVLQHNPAYTIDKTSVPNKVVFDTPPIWGQGENTKTVQEPLAVEKFFAHGIGNYLRCEIEKSGILTGSGGPFLILNSKNKKVQTVDDPRFAFVFIDGILQREGVSYTITGPAIRFTRKIFRENNIEIVLLYGRDIDQTVTLFDFQRNTYYNEIKITCDAGSSNNFIDWISWFNTSYDKFQVAYQKSGGKKKFIGNVKSYTTTSQTLVITLAGNNPDITSENIFFAGESDFSDEYELDGTTDTIEVIRNSDNDYRMQRNSGNWLYGTPRADESFYEKKRLLANLNAKDLIRIDGEKDFRTINELPRYTNPKDYNPGQDVSNAFFGSVTTTNYNGNVRGVGLSVTCEIENGSVSEVTWNRRDLQLLYDEGIIQPTTAYDYDSPPILHFVSVNQEGGGARAEVVVSGGQIIDIVLTKKGSGYTKPPKVITARSYDLIKSSGRKVDTFHTLGIGTQIGQSSPVAVASFIDIIKGVELPVAILDPSVAVPDSIDVTLIIQHIIDTAPLFTVSREYRFFNPFAGSTSIAAPTTQTDADILVIIEPKLLSDNILVTTSINITEFLEVGFSMWASDLVDLTFFNNINHWENSIFMDLGDIIAPSGDPVSEVQLAELEPYEIISDGSSSSAYPFNLGYSSINYYMAQLDTSDLPNQGDPAFLATGEVVYANTARFPSSGTILIGGEKISYTSKLADRFINCTRGAEGSPIAIHTIGDYLRNSL
jgi:hypothetical protein